MSRLLILIPLNCAFFSLQCLILNFHSCILFKYVKPT
jgi:hypothetical protein